jgi:hypothetical protein
VAGASLEVGKDSISIFASDELETRLNQLIEIHLFLCRLDQCEVERGEWRLLPGVRRIGDAAADHHLKEN